LLEKEARIYETERVRLVNEFGDESDMPDGTKGIEVKDPEKLDKFYKALEDVLKTEIDEDYYKIPKEDIDLIEDLEFDISEPQIRAFMEFAVAK